MSQALRTVSFLSARIPHLALMLVVACSALGCVSEDPVPIFIKIGYQVRCLDCEPRAADDPPHDLRVVDGSEGFRTACTREPWDDGAMYALELDTSQRQSNGTGGFAFGVQQARIGEDPGPNCRIRVREGQNTYEGRCSAAPPSAELPCQLALRAQDGVLFGSVACEHIPNLATTALWRSVFTPLTRDPAEFEVHGCPGL